MKYKRLIIKLLWIWQFPQNIAGLVYLALHNKDVIVKVSSNDFSTVYLIRRGRNCIYGRYIFLYQDYYDKKEVVQKFTGRLFQSLMAGPFYYMVRIIDGLLYMREEKFKDNY